MLCSGMLWLTSLGFEEGSEMISDCYTPRHLTWLFVNKDEIEQLKALSGEFVLFWKEYEVEWDEDLKSGMEDSCHL